MWKEKPSCVVAIPASPEFANIRQAVTQQLQAHEIEPFNYISEEATSAERFEALQRSDILIADVTDQSPNVLFDLGTADAMRKPMLLLAQKSSHTPSQLGGHQVLVYEPSDTEELTHYLDYWLRKNSPEQYK